MCKVADATISIGSVESVYVTFVGTSDTSDFFCQQTKTSEQLDNLMNEIEEYYRPLGDEDPYIEPCVGEACCVMFTEYDGWYRARVTSITGDTIVVCYLDYGNSETISLSRAKVLHSRFTVLATQGFFASLSVASEDDVDVSNFEARVTEKELNAKIVKSTGDGIYEVELSGLDGVKLFVAKDEQGK